MEFYGTSNRPNAFAMDSLEFLFLCAQYFREALPLRMIFLLISCQRAGGRISLTRDEMAYVLDVSRSKVADALKEIAEHGIVFKVKRGVYQFNPPYSYRAAEFIPGTETSGRKPEYIRVEQYDAITEIRENKTLPERVRYPSLGHMRVAIEERRQERAEQRAARPAPPSRRKGHCREHTALRRGQRRRPAGRPRPSAGRVPGPPQAPVDERGR